MVDCNVYSLKALSVKIIIVSSAVNPLDCIFNLDKYQQFMLQLLPWLIKCVWSPMWSVLSWSHHRKCVNHPAKFEWKITAKWKKQVIKILPSFSTFKYHYNLNGWLCWDGAMLGGSSASSSHDFKTTYNPELRKCIQSL